MATICTAVEFSPARSVRRRKMVYRCKDGHVSFVIAGGAYLNSTNAVIAWMKEEGAAPRVAGRERRPEIADPGQFHDRLGGAI